MNFDESFVYPENIAWEFIMIHYDIKILLWGCSVRYIVIPTKLLQWNSQSEALSSNC